MSTHETPSDGPDLSIEQVEKLSQEILGEKRRVEPLDAFCTPDYLQRTLDGYSRNPNTVISNFSYIGGGNDLITNRQAQNNRKLQDTNTPEATVIASSLGTFYRIGFGMVDNMLASVHSINQAEPEAISPTAYNTWLAAPQAERSAELQAYLHGCGATMLAMNFLDESHETGTILSFVSHLEVYTNRIDGEPPYIKSAASSTESKSELLEGTMAALFLIREHQIAQTLKDIEMFSQDLQSTNKPELPPDYYIG